MAMLCCGEDRACWMRVISFESFCLLSLTRRVTIFSAVRRVDEARSALDASLAANACED